MRKEKTENLYSSIYIYSNILLRDKLITKYFGKKIRKLSLCSWAAAPAAQVKFPYMNTILKLHRFLIIVQKIHRSF